MGEKVLLVFSCRQCASNTTDQTLTRQKEIILLSDSIFNYEFKYAGIILFIYFLHRKIPNRKGQQWRKLWKIKYAVEMILYAMWDITCEEKKMLKHEFRKVEDIVSL